MTIKTTLTTFAAAGMLTAAMAAHAQYATIPDPNLAPSTSAAEAELPGTPSNAPELATEPDPDLAPSISEAESELPGTPPNSPELAAEPNPNLAPPNDEQLGSQTDVRTANGSAGTDAAATLMQ